MRNKYAKLVVNGQVTLGVFSSEAERKLAIQNDPRIKPISSDDYAKLKKELEKKNAPKAPNVVPPVVSKAAAPKAPIATKVDKLKVCLDYVAANVMKFIDEGNLASEMRCKNNSCKVSADGKFLELLWVTQEDFGISDVDEFKSELYSAVDMAVTERFPGISGIKFKVKAFVICRDYYGRENSKGHKFIETWEY